MKYQYYDEAKKKWVNGKPKQNGQKYRKTDAAGGVVESYWYEEEAAE